MKAKLNIWTVLYLIVLVTGTVIWGINGFFLSINPMENIRFWLSSPALAWTAAIYLMVSWFVAWKMAMSWLREHDTKYPLGIGAATETPTKEVAS